MDPQLSTALSLLAIGMLTVFVVLALVVTTGNLLISVTNGWQKEDNQGRNDDNQINREHLVAMTAAVEIVTAGKGQIKEISQV